MGMYRFYGNSTFKIGDKVKIFPHCGIDSNKEAVVVPHFDWRKEIGSYSQPTKDYVPIKLEDDSLRYFSKNLLFKL